MRVEVANYLIDIAGWMLWGSTVVLSLWLWRHAYKHRTIGNLIYAILTTALVSLVAGLMLLSET